MKFEFESNWFTLNWQVDFCDLEEDKYVLYIPGMNFALEDIDWLSTIITSYWYNFVRFWFRYHFYNNINDCSISTDLEDIYNLFFYLDNFWYNIEKIGVIAKSLWGVKAFLLDDSRIKAYSFLAPAVFFEQGADKDKMKATNYGSIKNLDELILPLNIIENREYPTILFHGNNDEVVNISNSCYIYSKINYPKEFVSLSWMQHSIDEDNKENIGKKTALFFNKYL